MNESGNKMKPQNKKMEKEKQNISLPKSESKCNERQKHKFSLKVKVKVKLIQCLVKSEGKVIGRMWKAASENINWKNQSSQALITLHVEWNKFW